MLLRLGCCPSVCLSVRHKLVFYQKAIHFIVQQTPHHSPKTLVFWRESWWRRSNAVTRNAGAEYVAASLLWGRQLIIVFTSLQVIHTTRPNHKRVKSTSQLVSWKIESHTRTVMRQCCKDDDESLWGRAKFDPRHP